MSNFASSPTQDATRRTKPMIVDITVNDHGEQVYKVHGTRAAARKRKLMDEEGSDESPKLKRQSRPVLGSLSPNTLNQDTEISEIKSDSSDDSQSELKENNIWGADVQGAFVTALRMIPKNGLAKIKISGKSCGRNELISDFILQKTGKTRTRKQVSSHIQVIKNLRKETELIELINNGPSDPQSQRDFESIFAEISFKKSMGNPTNVLDSTPSSTASAKPSTPISNKKKTSRKSTPKLSQKGKRLRNIKNVVFQMRRFEMTDDEAMRPHLFSKLSKEQTGALKLQPHAEVQNRFPSIRDFFYEGVSSPEEQVPILHNFVKMRLPQAPICQHDTKLEVELKNIPAETQFGCLTLVYSFGNEVAKLTDEVIAKESKSSESSSLRNYTLKSKFGKEFWNLFFSSIDKNASEDKAKCEEQKTTSLKGITISQVFFSKRKESGFDKDDVRGIALYEFTRVTNEPAETTSRRLYIPTSGSSEIKYLNKFFETIPSEAPVDEIEHDDCSTSDISESSSIHQSNALMQNHLSQQQLQIQEQPRNVSPLEDYERDLDSANTTLQFDDYQPNEMMMPEPTLFKATLPINIATNLNQVNSFQMHQFQIDTPIQQPMRRFPNEPSVWDYQPSASSSPQLGFDSTTSSTVSSEGFNTDEFQGFASQFQNYTTTLNPSMFFEQGLKIEPDFATEVFPSFC